MLCKKTDDVKQLLGYQANQASPSMPLQGAAPWRIERHDDRVIASLC